MLSDINRDVSKQFGVYNDSEVGKGQIFKSIVIID